MQDRRKTLVLREFNEESVPKLLEKKDALASCDVIAVVYDRCGFDSLFFIPSLQLMSLPVIKFRVFAPRLKWAQWLVLQQCRCRVMETRF